MALWQKGDFLTFYCDGYAQPYYLGDYPNPDPRCVAEYESRGYTDIQLSVSIDNFSARHDMLLRPGEFRAWVARLGNLRVTPLISCPNDWDKECDRNAKFPGQVAEFARQVDDLVYAYAFGVEVWEWINEPRLRETAAALRQVTSKPIIVHFNQGEGIDRPGLWSYFRSLGGEWAISYQYNHSHGRPFLSTPEEMATTPQLVAQARAMGIRFIAGEYAFEVPEEQARERGAQAVALGADGCWNGC